MALLRSRHALVALAAFTSLGLAACGSDDPGFVSATTTTANGDTTTSSTDGAGEGGESTTTSAEPTSTTTTTTPPLSSSSRFALRGVGPLEAGMTVAEANTLLDQPIVIEAFDVFDGFCYFGTIPQAPGLGLLIISDGNQPAATPEAGIIGRFSTYASDSPVYATLSGVKPGDPEAKVYETYKNATLETEDHVYIPGGNYITFVPKTQTDSAFRLRFFTDGTNVTEIHTGLRGPSGYIEGCA